MYSEIGKTWQRVFHDKEGDISSRAVLLRRGPTVERLEKPSRLDRARMLGYKAKTGVVVVRIKVARGGMRRKRPNSGRRPKHLGVLKMKSDESVQGVAERRVREHFPNLRMLGSYIFYQDGKHAWYECVLIDPLNPSISKDYNYRRVLGLS